MMSKYRSGYTRFCDINIILAFQSLYVAFTSDLHVGANGAVDLAKQVFSNPPIPGFDTGAINCETNANSHNHQRALQEAADLIDWFTANISITNRLYARTASFCSGTSAQFDT